jgi:23S rRNA pseudoU1915 N3-methylase RlmH
MESTQNSLSASENGNSEVALSKWQIVLALSGMVICGTLVILIVIEVLFRAFSKPPVTWNDRPRGYFIPQNAQVLTDKFYSATKKPGTIRIAVVGDSFSFAPYMQYDDAFAKRMERWLNLNSSQPNVEVINYGVPRYSTSHEVQVVERAIREQADLILLQITLNDPEIKPYRPTGLLVDENTGNASITNPILKHWKSMAFVITRLFNTQSHRDYKKYFFDLFERKDTWNNFRGPLKTIVKKSSEANVALVATVFPLFGYPVDDNYPFFPLHQKVHKLLEKLSVPHLDLAEPYRGLPIERLQVMPGVDRHPNEIGHRIAAEAIIPWLQETKLLPSEIFPVRVVPEIGRASCRERVC